MALVVKDRVQETTTTTGTGTLTLGGAVTGFQTFSSAIGNTNTTYYAISSESSEFEVGIGTVAAGTLARTTILASSNGGSAVNLSAGTKNVFCTQPAEKSLYLDASGNTISLGILTSPKIGTSILDTNGNELALLTATASAVNEITLANAATGASPTISATGGDTNIGINLTPKGTGGIVLPAGAVGTPALTTSGDLNTGIFFPSADTIAFTEGGAEAMRINSSGNVGIGITTPVAKFEVGGALVDTISATFGGTIRVNSTTQTSAQAVGGIELPVAVDGYGCKIQQISASGAALVFADRQGSATWIERMRIDSSGNVLIGTTTSPAGSKELVLAGDYIEGVVANGTVTTTKTISLASGTVQTATLTASTACTFTMPTATAGKSFILLLKQAATTGNGTATFTGVKFNGVGAPTITATAGKMDILSFVADGTNWYGSITQGFTP